MSRGWSLASILIGTLIVRVGCNESFLGFGRNNLDMHVVLTGKEEAVADWEIR